MANYLLAGGGTGGHIYPGFAVAEAVRALDPAARIDFACTTRALDRPILKGWNGRILVQPIQPFAVRPMGFLKFTLGWWRTKFLVRRWLKENKIVGVLGLGGFGSGAAVYAASKLGLRTAFLNPDFVPGRANAWLSEYSEKIFVQFAGTQQYFHRPVEVVGVPLRSNICRLAGPDRADLRRQALTEFGLDPAKKTLVIMGGSTGARSLNSAAVKALGELADRMAGAWQVLHVTGSADYERVRAGETYHTLAGVTVKTAPYTDRMDLAWAMADAAICRAGAITLAELTAAQVPSVLLPYPYHRDNHQAKNADVLVRAGAAVMVTDDKVAGPETVGNLRDALARILCDETVRSSMVQSAATLRRVDAAERVARWLIGQ